MSFPTSSLPRPLEATELATGLSCKRHLYFSYHGLLEAPTGAIWEDHESFLERQRDLTRRAYREFCVSEGRTVPSDRVVENGLVRVSLAAEDSTLLTVVTSATSAKRSALLEAAAAYWIITGEALEVPKIEMRIAYLNRGYTPEDPETPLFVEETVTEAAAALALEVDRRLGELVDYLGNTEEVVRADSNQCAKPDRCPVCSGDGAISKEGDLFTLFRGREKVLPLYRRGVRRLEDIPANYDLGRRQRIQIASQGSSTIHVEPGPLEAFFESLEYPLGFLDFEAVQEAIPRQPLAKPWAHLPFLFSLHVAETEPMENGGFSEVHHHTYLSRQGLEDLEALAAGLADALRNVSSVVVYNREMEARSLRYLAGRFPAYAESLEGAAERLVDLYLPFQSFAIYHPKQQGSVSLKNVLPALTNLDHGGLAFRDGRSASLAYYWAHLDDSKGFSATAKRRIDDDLERYCNVDTLGLVRLVEAILRLLSKTNDLRAKKEGPTYEAGPSLQVPLDLIVE